MKTVLRPVLVSALLLPFSGLAQDPQWPAGVKAEGDRIKQQVAALTASGQKVSQADIEAMADQSNPLGLKPGWEFAQFKKTDCKAQANGVLNRMVLPLIGDPPGRRAALQGDANRGREDENHPVLSVSDIGGVDKMSTRATPDDSSAPKTGWDIVMDHRSKIKAQRGPDSKQPVTGIMKLFYGSAKDVQNQYEQAKIVQHYQLDRQKDAQWCQLKSVDVELKDDGPPPRQHSESITSEMCKESFEDQNDKQKLLVRQYLGLPQVGKGQVKRARRYTVTDFTFDICRTTIPYFSDFAAKPAVQDGGQGGSGSGSGNQLQ